MALRWVFIKSYLYTAASCNVVDRKLILVINSSDDNYVPHRIVVMGGSPGNLRKLSDVTVDQLVPSAATFLSYNYHNAHRSRKL